MYFVGTQQSWWRASRREFEMQTRRPEWRPASKTQTRRHFLKRHHAEMNISPPYISCLNQLLFLHHQHPIHHVSAYRCHLSILIVSVLSFFSPSLLLLHSARAYWGLRNHFPSETDALYNSLEPSYQRTLQSFLKSSGSVASLPQSDRSSSSSQESLK